PRQVRLPRRRRATDPRLRGAPGLQDDADRPLLVPADAELLHPRFPRGHHGGKPAARADRCRRRRTDAIGPVSGRNRTFGSGTRDPRRQPHGRAERAGRGRGDRCGRCKLSAGPVMLSALAPDCEAMLHTLSTLSRIVAHRKRSYIGGRFFQSPHSKPYMSRGNKTMRASSLLIGAVLALVAAGAYVVLRDRSSASPEGAGAPPPRPVPVTASTVEEQDFPIYRVGLGTVQAYNTVTVKVRVDGEVQQIAFREGQDVRRGDLLAQIDPRPSAALRQQAEPDRARDEALRASARLDLNRFSTLANKEFASRQSVDTQEAKVAQYKAAVQHDQGAID